MPLIEDIERELYLGQHRVMQKIRGDNDMDIFEEQDPFFNLDRLDGN